MWVFKTIGLYEITHGERREEVRTERALHSKRKRET
jgi:hypothetical protein